jgi:hypothetical protein
MRLTLRRLTSSAGAALLLLTGCMAPFPIATPTRQPTAPPTCEPGVTQPAPLSLMSADGEDIFGHLTSFSFCGNTGNQALPAADALPAVTLTHQETNVLVSTEGLPFIGWQAAYAPTTVTDLSAATELISETGEAAVDAVSFGGLPTGDWLFVMTLTYPGEIGSATYVWRVNVP